MTKKQHKTFKVVNPVSSQHVVRVCPSQIIQLRLDDLYFEDHTIKFSNSNFFIDKTEQGPSHCVYHIAHAEEVHKWADYSNVALGDICIDSAKANSKISVILDTIHKSKVGFMTCVNPDSCDVRILPGDILEVILYDETYGKNAEWFWEYHSELNAWVDLIGSSRLSLNDWKKDLKISLEDYPESPYARYPRGESIANKDCFQQHFWFRYCKSLLKLIEAEEGVKKIGSFVFYGYPDDSRSRNQVSPEFNLSIYMRFEPAQKKQQKMKAFNSLLLPTLESKSLPKGFILPASFSQPKLNTRSKKPILDVECQLIETKSLEEGCFTESVYSSSKKINQDGQLFFMKDKTSNHRYEDYRPQLYRSKTHRGQGDDGFFSWY